MAVPNALAIEPAYAAVIATPLPGPGVRLGLRMQGATLVALDMLGPGAEAHEARDRPAQEVVRQLDAYFADPRASFELPLRMTGSGHQLRVLWALCRIPVGETLSYGELARHLGSSARAVGGACRRNPIPVIIPCHRVVSASGAGGYMGRTDDEALSVKGWLLRHERRDGPGVAH